MIVIMTLLTVVSFVVADYLLHRRKARAGGTAGSIDISAPRQSPAPPQTGNQLSGAPGDLYYHVGHTWSRVLKDGSVVVGLDDFAQRLMGRVESIKFLSVGRQVRQGKTIWVARHGARTLSFVSPVEGTVIAVNPLLDSRPELVNESPYEEGWLVKIEPSSLQADLNNLLRGQLAEKWMHWAKMQFTAKFGKRLVRSSAEEAPMLECLSDRLSDEEWEKVSREFFSRAEELV